MKTFALFDMTEVNGHRAPSEYLTGTSHQAVVEQVIAVNREAWLEDFGVIPVEGVDFYLVEMTGRDGSQP